MAFTAIKTNDVVLIDGLRHLVTGVDIQNGEIQIRAQKIEPSVRLVPYKSIQKHLSVETASYETAEEAWKVGVHHSKGYVTQQQPMNYEQAATCIKTFLLKSVYNNEKNGNDGNDGKNGKNGKNENRDLISQSDLQDVITRISFTQSFLMANAEKQTVKTYGMDYPSWQQIARMAVEMTQQYNRLIVRRMHR